MRWRCFTTVPTLADYCTILRFTWAVSSYQVPYPAGTVSSSSSCRRRPPWSHPPLALAQDSNQTLLHNRGAPPLWAGEGKWWWVTELQLKNTSDIQRYPNIVWQGNISLTEIESNFPLSSQVVADVLQQTNKLSTFCLCDMTNLCCPPYLHPVRVLRASPWEAEAQTHCSG